MYKFLLIVFLTFFIRLPAFADFIPVYDNSVTFYGKGVISFVDDIKIYELDDLKSPVSAVLKNNRNGLEIKIYGKKSNDLSNSFIAYSKFENIALLPVEIDYDDWFYVCYDQKRKLFGWVNKTENIDYFDWSTFFNYFGRKHGLLLFRNLDAKYKKLHSAPNEDASVIDKFDIPKLVSLWLIKGDWMLVKVNTYDGKTKTGWMRWRSTNGNPIAFPDFE